jgi:gamma-glutamyl-gamma-aminobutyrate hydrolase PuuD
LVGVSTGFGDHGRDLGLVSSHPLVELGTAPVLVPFIETDGEREALLERLDGLVLGVGGDIDPSTY